MENSKRIRIVKRGAAATATATVAAAGDTAAVKREREARRETREVVSDWVRDHRRRADEFRQNYSTLLDKLGFTSPLSCRAGGA
jgi:hypothetical protein